MWSAMKLNASFQWWLVYWVISTDYCCSYFSSSYNAVHSEVAVVFYANNTTPKSWTSHLKNTSTHNEKLSILIQWCQLWDLILCRTEQAGRLCTVWLKNNNRKVLQPHIDTGNCLSLPGLLGLGSLNNWIWVSHQLNFHGFIHFLCQY